MRAVPKELLRTIKSIHLASLGILGTALLLLLAPFEDGYRRALNEAAFLKALQLEEYEQYARGFIGVKTTMLPHSVAAVENWPEDLRAFLPEEITPFLERITGWRIASDSTLRWDVIPILAYQPPPAEGTLQDWLRWITSKEPALYWMPEWKEAEMLFSPPPLNDPPRLRFFSLRSSNWRLSAREYTFRAFLEEPKVEPLPALESRRTTEETIRGLTPPETGWWSTLLYVPSPDLWLSGESRQLEGSGRFFVEGIVPSREYAPVARRPLGSINAWLRSSGEWASLTELSGLGESVLPGLHQHWSELAEKTLDESRVFMEDRQRTIRDINIFGLSVPGSLCIVTVPLALTVCYLYLLLHLRYALRISATPKSNSQTLPWFGLYNDPFASYVTMISLCIAPASLLFPFVFRYAPRAWSGTTIAVGGLSAVAVFLGWQNWLSTRALQVDSAEIS